jgi:uncharacterized oxidoreductase
MQLTNNTILITGATSGIGRALAEKFYQLGNQVIIAGRRQPLLNELCTAHPGMHAVHLDVTDVHSLKACALYVKEKFPMLNVLFNNAGICKEEALTGENVDIEMSETIIHTNIFSVLHLTTALLPTLQQQPTATIITTSSGLAFVPRYQYPTYCATKAFLHSWIQSLRVQLRETSVEVLELTPPYVQTELGGPGQLTDPYAIPLPKFIAEVMALLSNANLPGGEILVERVKVLRWAEKNNYYEEIFSALNEE